MDQGEEILRLLKEMRADQLTSMERQVTAMRRQKKYIRFAISISAIVLAAYVVWVWFVLLHSH